VWPFPALRLQRWWLDRQLEGVYRADFRWLLVAGGENRWGMGTGSGEGGGAWIRVASPEWAYGVSPPLLQEMETVLTEGTIAPPGTAPVMDDELYMKFLEERGSPTGFSKPDHIPRS